nr:MAG TPA: hypothetical protein [Caudoviricetes sp.]
MKVSSFQMRKVQKKDRWKFNVRRKIMLQGI